jgi:hypothetical protein
LWDQRSQCIIRNAASSLLPSCSSQQALFCHQLTCTSSSISPSCIAPPPVIPATLLFGFRAMFPPSFVLSYNSIPQSSQFSVLLFRRPAFERDQIFVPIFLIPYLQSRPYLFSLHKNVQLFRTPIFETQLPPNLISTYNNHVMHWHTP